MAALLGEIPEQKQKRKRKDDRETSRKLLVGQKVEVRSTEEGFHGSWHSATIIVCDGLERVVRYDHLLEDAGSEHLTERIKVSSLIEGALPGNGMPANYRGFIRPPPPNFVTDQWGFNYGLCVDAFVSDAWWEGVIFDHEDGSDERLVFFPDLGDQQMVKTNELRVTQDWDQVSNQWKRRGDWLFLVLIEEIEQEWPLLVSVRQLWYDLRSKEAFQENIGVWTFWVGRSMWKDLMVKVVIDNLNLTSEYVSNIIGVGCVKPASTKGNTNVSKLSLRNRGVEETQHTCRNQSESERTETDSLTEDALGGQLENNTAMQPGMQESEACAVSNSNCGALALTVNLDRSNDRCAENGYYCAGSYLLGGSKNSSDVLLRDLANKLFSNHTSSDCSVSARFNSNSNGKGGLTNDKSGGAVEAHEAALSAQGTWVPADEKVLPGAACFPDALENYLLIQEGGNICHKNLKGIDKKSAALKVRMHLSYLGWKIESKKYKNTERVRYISPNGKTMHSLIQVCRQLRKTKGRFRIVSSRNGGQTLVDLPFEPLGSSCQEDPFLKISKGHQMSESCSSKLPEKTPEVDLFENQAGPDGGASSFCAITQVVNSFQRESVPKDSCMVSKHHSCPKGLMDLCKFVSEFQDGEKCKIPDKLRLKAMKQLSALGWSYYCKRKQGKKRSYYISPLGSRFYSLKRACMVHAKGSILEGAKQMENSIEDKELGGPFSVNNSSSGIKCTGVEEGIIPINEFSEKDSSFFFASKLLQSQTNANFHTRRDRIEVPVLGYKVQGSQVSSDADSQQLKKWKRTKALTRQGDHLNGSHPTRVLRSSKRARHLVPFTIQHNPKNVLSWLIDNNVVLPRTKVYYLSGREQVPLAEGRVARDGIRCNCCQKVFGLSSFETHAGRNSHRPSASIFLEDGRSLLQCQMQLLKGNMLKSLTRITTEPSQNIKRKKSHDKNDYKCSICHYGGTLLLCDQCPSSFHLSCLGLEVLPEGKWFCPYCRCVICGESESCRNIEHFTEETVLCCHQCERQYHLGCANKMGMVKLDTYGKGNWFCSKKCEKIFVGLHELLGKAFPVGMGNLSWIILKLEDGYDNDSVDMEAMTEHYSKLNLVLSVMHECFEPIKEPQTKDIVRDVIFNKRSVLKRLDFKGFYTVLLEREDELISVATFRVYGEKVAEVPLVGTRVQFRHQGMCRILMSVIEKRLAELGVQRLVLPAASQALHAWTTSFGFSKMMVSERLDFLEHALLNFQDTTMCQKILRIPTAVKSKRSRGDRSKVGDDFMRRLLDLPMDDTGNNDSVSFMKVPSDMATEVSNSRLNQQSSETGPTENLIRSSDEMKEHKGFGYCVLKYYRRRKVKPVRNDATEVTSDFSVKSS